MVSRNRIIASSRDIGWQRNIGGLLLFLIFTLPLHAEVTDRIDYKQIQKLARSSGWRALLHMDEVCSSTIEDPSFFLSKFSDDPEKEMEALVQHLSPETVERFPARYLFLSENLGLDIPFNESERLSAFSRILNPASISVVFASAYLGSPMSYFGHTLVKFNKSENPYFSQVFGFAAELPDAVSMPSLIVNGLTGNLPGTYSFGPFFLVADRYLRTEQRYLIEYELDLTEYQIRLLSYHAYELMRTSFSYNFLSKNCTSELISFLSVVPDLILFNKKMFSLVTPNDLITAIKETDGVSGPIYYYPMVDRMQYVQVHMSPAERLAYHRILHSSSRMKILNEISDPGIRDTVAYLLSSGFDLRFRRFGIRDQEYREIDQLVYPLPDLEGIPSYTPIARPIKLSTGVMHSDEGTKQTFGFRPFYFDRRADRPNRLSDATLEFVSGIVSTDYSDINLEELTILRIESFPRFYPYFPMPSWRLSTGYEKRTESNELNYTGEFGIGISLGGSSFSLYGVPNIVCLVDQASFGVEVLFGGGFWLKQFHIGFDAKFPLLFIDGSTAERYELYTNLNLTERMSMSGSYLLLDQTYSVGLGLRF